ncbi:hypothetical protein [Secundilactobacillus malefermentans]|uniref:hypothetical protein n=1 Tax=Secundilactobacillus malefermentans TaxID=176292 RepID=UPI0011CC3DDB|nr:hypothetical protein [Secundilactobacillus malefermentans]QEA31786.1 hypothetical protein FGL90_06080 [Secundilactobacillus malefermentans]
MKFNKITVALASLGMVLPLAAATPLAVTTASAAEKVEKPAKTVKFTLTKSSIYKKVKIVHTKDKVPVLYKAAIGADRPTFNIKAKGRLQAGHTYYVSRKVTAKSVKTGKVNSFSYVRNEGWVYSKYLTAGIFKQAD